MPAKPTAPNKPTAPKRPSLPGRLYNLSNHNRIRVEIPTGEVRTKNGDKLPQYDVHWIVGSGDAGPSEPNENFIELTARQVDAVRADKGLSGMLSSNTLSLQLHI